MGSNLGRAFRSPAATSRILTETYAVKPAFGILCVQYGVINKQPGCTAPHLSILLF